MSAALWGLLATGGTLLVVYGILIAWAKDAEKRAAKATAENTLLRDALHGWERSDEIMSEDVSDESAWITPAVERLRDESGGS